MATQAQRRAARERGEARFAELVRRDEDILKQQRQEQEAADAKFQRLRALRLAREEQAVPDSGDRKARRSRG
jgi:hypothetical protein